MTGTTNIDELLSLLDMSESLLLYNSEIIEDITQNGGTVVYSYNNIIIATEINEIFFNELNNNNNIEFIKDIPMKKYGEVSNNLVGQLDIDSLTNTTTTTINSESYKIKDSDNRNSEKIIDGKSGKSRKPLNDNIIDNERKKSENNLQPVILNNNFTINTQTDNWVNYIVLANGTLPFKYELVKPENYDGDLYFYNNIISGSSLNSGTYDIIFKVINDYGYDKKTIKLNIVEPIKITNDKFNVYNKLGSFFSYTIESSGGKQKTYSVDNLPSELVLNNNVISGHFINKGEYIMELNVSGITSSDSENLVINVGEPPLIISSGDISSEQYSEFIYEIESNNSGNTIYEVLGILPEGLTFIVNKISGIPIYSGVFNLKIKATNPYGISTKDLKITIYQINN